MKEIKGSLPEVIKAYSAYNLLVPTATDVQLNPFYKFHIEEVAVDLSESSGDIFKVGSTKNGNEWIDMFSLSKPLLNKLAMAAGIQFNPNKTYGERIDRITYRAQAQGAMLKADGTYRTETDQKVICLEDEEEKFRIEFSDKANMGIADQKQAKAAAEIFKGTWIPTKDKYGNTKDSKGNALLAFLIDEKDRERYIERSVMVNMALLKKTWAEKAMTGAKLRVIRALLGVKGTYTKRELQKNFAIPTVIFSPDYNDPTVRQAMLKQGMNSMSNMFGIPNIETKQIDFDDAVSPDVVADIENPAFVSGSEENPADDYQQPDFLEPEEAETQQYCCDACGAEINERVYEYSLNKFGRPLCIKCQRGGSGR